MALPSPAAVLSHWCNLIEAFNMPPLDFYAAVEESLKRREVPKIEISRVDWNEGGVFDAKREYLRIARGPHVFEVCGAPFGTGFFVSSWLTRPRVAPWPLVLAGLCLVAGFAFFLFTRMFGFLAGPPLFVIGYPFLFWVFTQMMQDSVGWDDSIVEIPFLGAIYERIFRPATYYRIDTALMFQQAVHNAVLEAIDRVTDGKGLRGLSEFERKPVLTALAKGAGS
jgi:hypothetical protein